MKSSPGDIIYERILDAPRERVWKAWTDPEMIKKWWGPKNFTAPEVYVDLRKGGSYLYCMRGSPAPGAPVRDFWSAGSYREIVPMEKLVVTDTFSDEHGNIVDPLKYGMSKDYPKEAVVTILFEDVNGKTKLSIIYAKPLSDAAYEAMVKSGMDEGWNQSLDKLEDSLSNPQSI